MIITCHACNGRKLVSPLGGMPLPCAICNGVGFIDTKPLPKELKVEPLPPPNPLPDITLQEPITEKSIKCTLSDQLGKKRTSKREQVREALRKIAIPKEGKKQNGAKLDLSLR